MATKSSSKKAQFGRAYWLAGLAFILAVLVLNQPTDRLSAAKAKTIGETVFFFEQQVDRGQSFIRQMTPLLAANNDAANAQMSKVIAAAERTLDTDAVRAGSMKNAGNVLVPSVFALGEPQDNPDQTLASYATASAIKALDGFGIPAISGQQSLEQIGSVAAGIAHLNQIQDVDGAVHHAAPATSVAKPEQGFEKTVVLLTKKADEPSPSSGGGTVPDVEI